jgi:hypothetical protein
MFKSDGTPANVSTGARSQCNPAMPAILVAALSVLDFFLKADRTNTGQVVIADTTQSEENNWDSYPYNNHLRNGMIKLQRLSLLWRLIENKTSIPEDWESLYKPYTGFMGSGRNAFSPNKFLDETDSIREFFLGQGERTDASEPWNIGAEGFLQELEYNGLGKIGTINMTEDIKTIDNVRFKKSDDVSKSVAGIPILALYDKLIQNHKINVGTLKDDDMRRTKFIAGATASCLP